MKTPAEPGITRTSRRLVLALLDYFVLVTLVITLSPFDFGPPHLHVSVNMWASDVLLNIGLFVPIGFLLRSQSSGPGRNWIPVIWSAGFSILIEVAQLFLPSRYVAPMDVLANTCGAWVGVALRHHIERWVLWRPAVIGRIGLDVPLVGLVYLLVPQLWLSSVGLVEDEWRSVTTLLLGCAGSIVLVALHRHRWPGGVRVAAHVVPPLALLWFLVGALPALTSSPRTFATMAAGVAALTWWLMRAGPAPQERRFETDTLKRFLPVFATYLMVAALWPLPRPLVPWHGAIAFSDGLRGTSVVEILELLEQVGGFTLLGYALAEWRGRDEARMRTDLPRVGLLAIVFAVLLEVAQAHLAGPGASALRALLAVAGAVYGAALYHLARDHVRTLRGRHRRTVDEPKAA